MSKQSTFVGLDVHADTIAVAVVQGRDVVRSLGIVPNTPEALRRIRAAGQFSKVRDHLRAFEDLELDHIDYENAAACFNECRAKGVQGADTDFLLCAASLRRDLPIFSEDGDFPHYQRVLGLRLHGVRAAFAR